MVWHGHALKPILGGTSPDSFGAAYINNLIFTLIESTLLDLWEGEEEYG